MGILDNIKNAASDTLRDLPRRMQEQHEARVGDPYIKTNIEMLLDENYDDEKINNLICKYYGLNDIYVDHMIADVRSSRRRRNNGQR